MAKAKAQGKPRPVGPKIRAAIGFIVDGLATTQVDAAKLAGCTPEGLCRALKKEHVTRFAIELARANLKALPALIAGARIASLLKNGKSEEVVAKLAIRVAENAGILARSDANANGIVFPDSGPVLCVVFRNVATPEPIAAPPSPPLIEQRQPAAEAAE